MSRDQSYSIYGGLLYPPVIWAMELHGLIFLCAIQVIRIYYGLAANRMESSKMTCIFIFLTIFTLLPILHYASFSTYVLEIEIFMSMVNNLDYSNRSYSIHGFFRKPQKESHDSAVLLSCRGTPSSLPFLQLFQSGTSTEIVWTFLELFQRHLLFSMT